MSAHILEPLNVQYCPTLDGEWEDWDGVRVLEFSHSGSGSVGRCVLEWDLGLVAAPVDASLPLPQPAVLVGRPFPSAVASTVLGWPVGLWVRLRRDETPIAYYRVLAWGVTPGGGSADNADGTARYEAVCPLGVLDQIFISTFPEISQGGGSVAFRALPANDTALGNRSLSTVGATYVMDPRAISARARWTAKQFLEALFASNLPASVTLSVRDAGCLDYPLERTEVYGHSVAQVLSDLCGGKRGLSYRVRVFDEAIIVSVGSAVDEAITAGAFTLPAAPIIPVDLADSLHISGVSVQVDDTGTYDWIELRGSQPWVMVTLGTDDSLEPHWESSEETLWEENPAQRLARRVYREWRVRASWNGATWGGADGVRNVPGTSGGFFDLGYDGTRSWGAGADAVSPQSLELTQQLPETVSNGINYGQYGSYDLLVMAGSGTTGEEQPWRASVESEPARIILDDGNDGLDIAGAILDSLTILVTVGVREAMPLTVSHLIDDGITAPLRRLVQRVPGIEQWRITPGAVTGVLPDGTLRLSGGYFRRDDVPTLQQRAALAAAWYSRPQVTASWADGNGLAAWALYDHGDMLSLSCGWDFPGPVQVRTVTVRAVQAEGGPYWQATIQAERTAPDYELSVPVPRRVNNPLGAIMLLRNKTP